MEDNGEFFGNILASNPLRKFEIRFAKREPVSEHCRKNRMKPGLAALTQSLRRHRKYALGIQGENRVEPLLHLEGQAQKKMPGEML